METVRQELILILSALESIAGSLAVICQQLGVPELSTPPEAASGVPLED